MGDEERDIYIQKEGKRDSLPREESRREGLLYVGIPHSNASRSTEGYICICREIFSRDLRFHFLPVVLCIHLSTAVVLAQALIKTRATILFALLTLYTRILSSCLLRLLFPFLSSKINERDPFSVNRRDVFSLLFFSFTVLNLSRLRVTDQRYSSIQSS